MTQIRVIGMLFFLLNVTQVRVSDVCLHVLFSSKGDSNNCLVGWLFLFCSVNVTQDTQSVPQTFSEILMMLSN